MNVYAESAARGSLSAAGLLGDSRLASERESTSEDKDDERPMAMTGSSASHDWVQACPQRGRALFRCGVCCSPGATATPREDLPFVLRGCALREWMTGEGSESRTVTWEGRGAFVEGREGTGEGEGKNRTFLAPIDPGVRDSSTDTYAETVCC